ncbi:hypothetical protein HY488_00080 [Candidatus Woesearchaeota archaeon]|nr:hypothetical protein [Candidatus Woesearchaeota archaeon]
MKKELFFVLALSVLLLGCTAPSEPSETTTPTPSSEPSQAPSQVSGLTVSKCEDIITFEEIKEACGLTVEPPFRGLYSGEPNRGSSIWECDFNAKYSGAGSSYNLLELSRGMSGGDQTPVQSKPDYKELTGIGKSAYEYTDEFTYGGETTYNKKLYFSLDNIGLTLRAPQVELDSAYEGTGAEQCGSFEALEAIAKKIADRVRGSSIDCPGTCR